MSHATTSRHAQNVGNFLELLDFCAGLDPARYHPVRLNLKIQSLQGALAAAQEALAKVDLAHGDLGKLTSQEGESAELGEARSRARLVHEQAMGARNQALYATGEGLVDLANDCKAYLKSLKAPKEENLHHILHLDFRAPA